MQPLPATPRPSAARTAGPPRIFWIAQIIAAIVIGLPLLAYGIYCLQSGVFVIPYAYRVTGLRGIRLEHGAAQLAAWAAIIAGVAAALHAGLSSVERVKHAAASAARFGGGVALLLFVAALVAYLVG